MRGMIRMAMFALLSTALPAAAQPPDYKAELAKWNAQRDLLRTQAKNALSAETAREKAGACPDAVTTLDIRTCLASDIAKTQANYDTFATAIRAMLALPVPGMPGEQATPGPTGLPAPASELVDEFDRTGGRLEDISGSTPQTPLMTNTRVVPLRPSSECRRCSGWYGCISRNLRSSTRKNCPTANPSGTCHHT